MNTRAIKNFRFLNLNPHASHAFGQFILQHRISNIPLIRSSSAADVQLARWSRGMISA